MPNPADDESFGKAAERSLLPGMTAERLEAALRPRYPRCVVHERLLASEPVVVWYVYRDGRWVGRGWSG